MGGEGLFSIVIRQFASNYPTSTISKSSRCIFHYLLNRWARSSSVKHPRTWHLWAHHPQLSLKTTTRCLWTRTAHRPLISLLTWQPRRRTRACKARTRGALLREAFALPRHRAKSLQSAWGGRRREPRATTVRPAPSPARHSVEPTTWVPCNDLPRILYTVSTCTFFLLPVV